MFGNLVEDVRYAARTLRKAPVFTAVAMLSLALGIGANSAIFSLINAIMLRTLPVHEPGNLVELLSRYPGEPRVSGVTWKYYEHFRDENQVFSALIASSPSRLQIAAEGLDAQMTDGEYVTGNYFSALGIKPAIGRLITPQDD